MWSDFYFYFGIFVKIKLHPARIINFFEGMAHIVTLIGHHYMIMLKGSKSKNDYFKFCVVSMRYRNFTMQVLVMC